MTTEDDFQAALDADPSDWMTRLVFADWLEEQGDERAEGYRALGAKSPMPGLFGPYGGRSGVPYYQWWAVGEPGYMGDGTNALPRDWANLVEVDLFGDSTPYHATRRLAEDAAALAFAKLPAERRAELLALAPVGA